MGFAVIMTVAAILSAGILKLALPDDGWSLLRSRFVETRKPGAAFLRVALAGALSAAGKHVYSFRASKRRELVQREIYSALSILRNHASSDAAITTDCLLEQFAQTDGTLKGAYDGTLRLLRTGRQAEATEYFAGSADVPLARDFILLVLDWDAVPPEKLKQTIMSFQNALKETRTTELTRKNEVLSDLVYMPVIAGVLIIFVNFIYVAYFAEQRALLAELFY